MAITSRPTKNTAVLPRASSALPTMMKKPPVMTARCEPRR